MAQQQAQSNTRPPAKSSRKSSQKSHRKSSQKPNQKSNQGTGLQRILVAMAAGVIIILAAAGALFQQPHPDPFRATRSWDVFNLDWWRYPVEQNAFKRLPVVRGNLRSVFVLPGTQQVWAVGDHGLIVHSPDGGKTWEQQRPAPVISPTPDDANLQDIFFTDATRGWAVGDKGTILATTDAGRSWQPQTSGTTAWLSSVQFLDATRGWAVGINGTILATTDAGRSWQAQTSGTTAWLYSVQFLDDATRGWAVGDGGTILATTDAGRSWQAQTSGTLVRLLSVQFLDTTHGWAVGAGGTILATTDAGRSWQAQTSDTTAWLYSVQFLDDATRGWAVGDGGTILATTNAGRSWQAQTSGTLKWLGSVQFFDAARGWAVGNNGTILTTADAGRNWQPQTSGTMAGLVSVQFVDATRGWAVGYGGTILTTTDAGRSWKVQTSGTKEWLESVHFLHATRGWAVGGGGTILATDDGGRKWREQTSGTRAWLMSVHFPEVTRGWAVGGGGTILATDDGGQNWRAQTSGTKTDLWSVHFPDATRGWAVGEDGTILATDDGGQNWRAQTSGRNAWLLSVYFPDATRGWAMGEDGTILATTDAGRSWQPQTSGTTERLSSVQFVDATRGWAVGWDGTILTTADAGRSWQAQTSGTTAWLESVQFLDATRGWVVGSEGTILATTDGGKTWENIAKYSRSPAPWVYAQLFLALLFAAWAVSRRPLAVQSQVDAGIAGIFVSDRPLGPGDADHLGHGVVARGLANFIRNENTEPGLTVAVTGAWGLGKSSVMRLLEHSLQSAGFRTAWFNAWHHQQEGRQLASMLNAIRGQAIPPGYSVKGLRLRFKLLWQRGWWYRGMLMLLLLVVTVAVCELSGTKQPQEDIWRNVKFHILERKPTVLTEISLKRIEDENVTAPDAIKFMRTHMLWHADPTQPDKGTCLAERDAKWDSKKDKCEFENHAQLITSLERKLDRTLPAEERAAITSAAQHLPPPPLLEGLSVLATLAGAMLLVFVGKGFTVFGFDISALLGRFVPGQRPEAGKEAVGTLEHFRHEFGLITEALEGRLVLFIDDLDRCDCATVREVLDMVNYLVCTGQCFIVLGVAMEHIECCIESKSAKQPQDVYARDYLKKLINIEVPVPVAPLARSRKMLEKQATEQRTEPGLDRRHWFGRIMVITIFAGVVGAGYGFNALMPTPPVEFRTPPAAETVAAPVSKAAAPAVPADSAKTLQDTRDYSVGVERAPEVSMWPTLLVVILVAMFVVVIGVLSFLPREQVREWLEKKLKRAKIAAGGAERTVDSTKFVEALNIWHDVIALGDPTPRGIKRFVNRVRLFAMRERAACDDKTEASQTTSNTEPMMSDPTTEKPLDDATLVALAALHHMNKNEVFNLEMDLATQADDNAHAIGPASQEHKNAGLPWPPTPDQIQRFKKMAQGFHIH